ncbi:MAG: hypothetical protein A2148_08630 [Chloroflexi bacterium RBG_16_68_14]|nr:MAG: hypothetical protein A2148_08630 [Chloroflexi bacterium RBG_16_68_14]
MALAENLRRLRSERQLSREKLANLCGPGYGYSTIANIENRRVKNPDTTVIEAIASALETTPEQLTQGEFNEVDEIARLYEVLLKGGDLACLAWAGKALTECRDFLRALQQEQIRSPVPRKEAMADAEIGWWLAFIDVARATVDATSCVPLADWWESEAGQRYLDKNVALMALHAVRVRRIFVFNSHEDYDKNQAHVMDQQRVGIEVACAILDDLDSEGRALAAQVWDIAIVDGKWLIDLPNNFTRSEIAVGSTLTSNKPVVSQMQAAFDRLWKLCATNRNS